MNRDGCPSLVKGVKYVRNEKEGPMVPHDRRARNQHSAVRAARRRNRLHVVPVGRAEGAAKRRGRREAEELSKARERLEESQEGEEE